MTTDTESETLTGIIGTRQLTVVQTFGIARLTSDPVVLIPSTFVAVTGRGPKDSNESGKTSFLASVALLLGDPEWQITGNGTANATNMLFEPVIAGASAHLVGAAERGYVVGLFTDSHGQRPHTVWLQISNDQPHIQVRHQPGIHLLTEGTDSERHDAATDFYRKLGIQQLGSSEYAQQLYGRSPKVLAYVASRGQVRSRPSLLKLEAATYSPDRIGDALITLSGRSTLLEHDTKQRRELDERRAEYERALEKHTADLIREDKILEAVAIRNDLRREVANAQCHLQACRARAVLDAAARVLSARTLLPTVESRLSEAHAAEQGLRKQLDTNKNAKELEETEKEARREHKARNTELIMESSKAKTAETDLKEAEGKLEVARTLASRHVGESSAALLARMAELTRQKEEAQAHRILAEREAKRFHEELCKAELGRAGQVGEILAVLDAVGIEAIGVHDQIELDVDARDRWEAALQPWQDAVCVPETHLADALEALKGIPGAMVISSPAATDGIGGDTSADDTLPAGIKAAPSAVSDFLHVLSTHSTWDSMPPHATLDLLNIHIVGGFPSPVVGREAICAHLRTRRDSASAEAERQSVKMQGIAVRTSLAEDQLSCAKAAEILPELQEECRTRTKQLADLRQAVVELTTTVEAAGDAWSDAKAAVAGRLERIKVLTDQIARALSEIKGLDAQRADLAAATSDEALKQARSDYGGDEDTARLQLNWPSAWVPESPGELLAEAPVPPAVGEDGRPAERRSAADLRSAYISTIDGCRTVLRLQNRAHGYPTSALARAVEAGDAAPEHWGDAVLRALVDWLTDNEATDADAEAEVTSVRKGREDEHSFIAASVEKLAKQLHTTQAAISQRVSSALDSIARALNRLDQAAQGFGADLLYQIDPPSDTDHTWRCSVTPRWRRNPNGPLLSYDTVTNTAQEKLFSINLVLAALLAAPNAQGRVLVLDELGDSLGQEHRRDVLAAISSVAAEHGITILGTCQDTIMRDVAPVCGEILYFHYPSKSEYLNLPTRMFGYDADTQRVELTAEDLLRRVR
ncbi:hypothetical protein ACWCWQ_23775 [Streptomyces sp. NPDC001571]